ncbi:methionyl-tRNA formyltransferase [Candidatus Kaiserbacteria bacterium]|nr:methionyl-tRNA formyltransferase [Candidatus Kaiserbacteria bacterium]
MMTNRKRSSDTSLAVRPGSTESRRESRRVRFAFFGTSHIAVYVLDALEAAVLVPGLIVTQAPKPKGRGLEPKPTEVEAWARTHGIPVAYDSKEFENGTWDVAVVVDYGNFLPKQLLDIPKRGFLNVHPSLLPRLRGASPMRSAILNDEKTTGVSIMLVNERMDEGPIVAQKKINVEPWPVGNAELENILVPEGGKLLAQILPQWVAGEIDAHEQNHDVATYAEKITKEDGLLDLQADAYKNLLKIRAYEGWPGTYAFFERSGKKIRVGIIDARIENNKLIIDKVKPEGKKEMGYEEFLRSGAKLL